MHLVFKDKNSVGHHLSGICNWDRLGFRLTVHHFGVPELAVKEKRLARHLCNEVKNTFLETGVFPSLSRATVIAMLTN